jgi:hypothetical protein
MSSKATGDAQRTRQAQKVKKGGSTTGSSAKKTESQASKELKLILASLDAPMGVEPNLPLSDEEKARRHEIGRQYVIGKFEQHNTLDHDLTCKIYLKNHAINMLPRNTKLRDDAMNTEDGGAEDPPPWRHIPTWTPPIKNFKPSDFIEKKDS